MAENGKTTARSNREIIRLHGVSEIVAAQQYNGSPARSKCHYDNCNDTIADAVRSSTYYNESRFVFYRNGRFCVGMAFPWFSGMWYWRVKSHYDANSDTYHVRMVENLVNPSIDRRGGR